MITRAVVLIALTSAEILGAQMPATQQSSYCWRARPLAECRNWVITETSFEIPIVSTSVHGRARDYPDRTVYPFVRDFGPRFSFTLGAMANTGASHATGPTITVSDDEPGVSGSFELRRRRWIDSLQAIDFSGGLTVRETPHADWQKISWTGGLTASVVLDLGSAGLSAHVDAVKAGGRVATSILAGGHAAGKAGIWALLGYGGWVVWAIGTGYGAAT